MLLSTKKRLISASLFFKQGNSKFKIRKSLYLEGEYRQRVCRGLGGKYLLQETAIAICRANNILQRCNYIDPICTTHHLPPWTN
jgi:hypothetical protein